MSDNQDRQQDAPQEAPPGAATPSATSPKPRSVRGFAAMNPEQQRAIARLGGRAAHRKGVAHEFTSQEAREAGRIGGHNSHVRKRELRERQRVQGEGGGPAGNP